MISFINKSENILNTFFVETCEDKGHCKAEWCGRKDKETKEYVTKNCRKTCGICKGGKEEIKSSELQATDCKQSSWGEWSKCSKPCGGGVQERTRTIVTPASNGGKACSGPNKDKEKACSIEACPGKNQKFQHS